MRIKSYLYSILLIIFFTSSAYSYYEDDDLPDGYRSATPEEVTTWIEEEQITDFEYDLPPYAKAAFKHSKNIPDSNRQRRSIIH